jgi:hypothetical protein
MKDWFALPEEYSFESNRLYSRVLELFERLTPKHLGNRRFHMAKKSERELYALVDSGYFNNSYRLKKGSFSVVDLSASLADTSFFLDVMIAIDECVPYDGFLSGPVNLFWDGVFSDIDNNNVSKEFKARSFNQFLMHELHYLIYMELMCEERLGCGNKPDIPVREVMKIYSIFSAFKKKAS